MKVLLSPSSIGILSKEPIDLLESKGHEVIVNPYGRRLVADEIVELAAECEGIVAGVETYNPEVIDSLPKLKCISRVGVGMDSIDVPYAESKGIKVTNTPNGPTQAVAELALGLTMAALRKIAQAHHNLKSGIWKKENGYLLQGKTVGVIGVGRIGRKTSELFHAIGNQVLAYDLYPDLTWATSKGIRFLELNTLLMEADIVILHLPGSSNGKPFITDRELSLMKQESILINLARGGVVDEVALAAQMAEGKFAGVALDVFSEEPYNGDLLKFEQVTLTPHLGSYAKEGKVKMELDAVINLLEVLNA